MPPRCFLGCSSDLVVHLHVFPNPARFSKQFKMWVQIVGGQLNTPDDFAFFRKQRLCNRHFTEKDQNRNNRLNALAVPSLFLKADPADTLTPTTKASETGIETSVDVPLLQSTSLIDVMSADPADTLTPTTKASETGIETSVDVPLLQSTSLIDVMSDEPAHSSMLKSTVKISEIEGITKNVPPLHLSLTGLLRDESAHPLTSSVQISSTEVAIDIPPLQTSFTGPLSEPITSTFMEHNYSKILLPKKYNLAPLDAIIKKPVLTLSKNRNEQNQLKSLKRQIKLLRQQCTSFKSRLASASKMSADFAFQKVTKSMTSAAKLFTNMQFRQTQKKPSGRRFSLEEKILSLSLFKRSPKCYSLLSHCFTLPSKKTLKGILALVKLGPGVNGKIFEKLKKTVTEMSVEDRLCCLIFDEMSLTPQINYDMANDKLKGFVSMGTNNNENEIADHVLVFMVKGIKANFKQPVAYYFTNSLTRRKLQNIIKEVVQEVHATGLIPLCSVCDQSSVNVGAISDLVQESKNKVYRLGKEWRHDFYEINKQK